MCLSADVYEAFVRITNAYGAKRPDEVAVLYYNSADAGENFGLIMSQQWLKLAYLIRSICLVSST
jgi:hypothetical protein